jgi:hypothetical protein
MRANGDQPNEQTRKHVGGGGEPRPVLEQRVRFEPGRRKRCEGAEETDPEREAHGIRICEHLLSDDGVDDAEQERSAHIDQERPEGKPRFHERANQRASRNRALAPRTPPTPTSR